MRSFIHVGLTAAFLVAIAAGVIVFWSVQEPDSAPLPVGPVNLEAQSANTRPVARPLGRTTRLFGDHEYIDSGADIALRYTPPVYDQSSIAEARGVRRERGKIGMAALRQQMAPLPPDHERRPHFEALLALLQMYEGEFTAAIETLDRLIDERNLDPERRDHMIALRAVANLRRGEVENCVACVGPSSCIFPIAREAVHQKPEGSRAAVRDLTDYLSRNPEDYGARWLLNLAAMTLGEYPDKVPAQYLIPLDPFRSRHDPGRFVNIAANAGLNSRGPNMLGGSVFDDFTGDGLADILVATVDFDLGASLFVNRGDGTFEDRGGSMGLSEQMLACNTQQADFDNDGKLDVLILRGGWDDPCRLSLLRNTGTAFEDVTLESGLGEAIPSQSAAWGDYDNDGRLDLYVCGESSPVFRQPMNRCRLYHNEGAGKFRDLAEQAGVLNERFAKGACWGDYDSDGHLDLYVSNYQKPNRLYHNNGNGTFTDLAEKLGVTEPLDSFACWFWDYDNDGRLDIFVASFRASVNGYARSILRLEHRGETPRLFRNLGPDGFKDVTRETGLDRVFLIMGSNFADIDNDGYLDVYLGTGQPPYSSLFPNVMLKNISGERFDDVTLATGTGHLQKGHGVSFADWDGDGDLDLFVEIGGATPGDRSHNALFQNPGHGRHWIALKLVGTKTNRAALGARVRVDFRQPDGRLRSIYRVVGSGSSFGGNSLVVHAGLDRASKAESITVSWPASKTEQTFRDVDADQTLEITEGTATPRKLKTLKTSPRNVEQGATGL